jgi:flagellar protein FlaG
MMVGNIGPLRLSGIASQENPKAVPRAKQAAGPSAPSEGTAAPSAAAVPALPREMVDQIATDLEKALRQFEGDYSVTVDHDSGNMVVRIRDSATGEVVKQIPPQELLDVRRSVEQIVGILIDDRA